MAEFQLLQQQRLPGTNLNYQYNSSPPKKYIYINRVSDKSRTLNAKYAEKDIASNTVGERILITIKQLNN